MKFQKPSNCNFEKQLFEMQILPKTRMIARGPWSARGVKVKQPPRADPMACASTGPVLLGRLPWPVQSQGPGCCGRDLGQRSHGCFPATAARTYVYRNGLFAQYSPVPCVASTNSPAFWKARHIRAYVVLGVYNPNKLQAQLKLHRDYIIAI